AGPVEYLRGDDERRSHGRDLQRQKGRRRSRFQAEIGRDRLTVRARGRSSRRRRRVPEFEDQAAAVALSSARLHRLAVPKIDLDEFLARRNSRDDLFGLGIDYRAAIRVGVLAVEAEADPARVRRLLRILEQRNAGEVLRGQGSNVVGIDISINAVDYPNLFLIGTKIDPVAGRTVRLARRRIRDLGQPALRGSRFHPVQYLAAPFVSIAD